MTGRAALLFVLLLAACRQDMARQPRLDTHSAAPAFTDGSTVRPLPPGTVPRETSAVRPGRISLSQGREQYGVYCAPCHGPAGYGDGMIVQRGFPAPPSFHSRRLVRAPAEHFFDVITDGYGAMYSYRDRVEAPDRRAIIAYIRALQLSQAAAGEGGR